MPDWGEVTSLNDLDVLLMLVNRRNQGRQIDKRPPFFFGRELQSSEHSIDVF